MLPVQIVYNLKSSFAMNLGQFTPDQVESIVQLVKDYGIQFEQLDDRAQFDSACFDQESGSFIIYVE